ncbi:MAG: type IX secretion system PorP/SprF family membrane protein [Cognaticolwellia sp.]|jgi:type IX secretion system PorP/SprF family membrane protein
MYRQLLISCLLIGLSFTAVKAQDPIFSQFYATPMQLNPALTGSSFVPRISLNYRNQWPALSNAYITYSASYDQFFDKAKSGLGFTVMADVAGDGIYKTNKIGGSYAYNLEFSRDFYLKAGFEVGIGQVTVDWDNLIFLDQIDPLRGPLDLSGNPFPSQEERPFNLSTYYGDFGAGFVAYSKSFYGGFSIKHVNSPNESLIATRSTFGLVPLRFTIHGGAEISIRDSYNNRDKGTFISPNVMYVRQGEFQQLNVGAYANFESLFGGIWYRHTFTNVDAAIILLGTRYKMFKIGYSYDLTISELTTDTGGAHEVSVSIYLEQINKRKGRNYLNCLKMFQF